MEDERAEVGPFSLLSVSTFRVGRWDEAGFGGRERGLPCLGSSTVGIGRCGQLEWVGQKDAIWDGTGLARGWRRLGLWGGRKVTVGLPGGRELNLTCWACVLLILLLLVIVWDKRGSVYGVRGGDLGFEVGGVSLRRRRRGAVVVSGGGACGRRGLVVPG